MGIEGKTIFVVNILDVAAFAWISLLVSTARIFYVYLATAFVFLIVTYIYVSTRDFKNSTFTQLYLYLIHATLTASKTP
jgi:hypothetical protein